MIINSLLFVIVCIFVYETFNTLTKMTEEYFSNLEKEQFVSLGSDPDKNDISKTIAINCKVYPTNANSLMLFKPESDDSLDTPFYSQFKPLKYNPKRKYYWRSNKLVQEGKRRSLDDENEIEKVQTLLENETDPDKQLVYQEELNLSNWRNNILDNKDSITELDRSMRDITSDYFPEEIGMNRPWIERHSHIPDYSY